jgi:hypothetical protein
MATVAQLNPDFAPALPPAMAGPANAILGRPPLDLVRIAANVLVIMALLLLNKGGNIGAGVFFAILTVMIFMSPKHAFQALAICWLGLMINTSFVPKSIVWTPARLALPLIAFLRFSFDISRMGGSLFSSPVYILFLVYIVTMAACSVASGWYTQIALMKLVNFWAVISTILAGVTVLRRMRVDLTEWFVSLVAATTLFGLLSIALGVDNKFRSYSADVESNAFVGAFLHPNCHSVYATLFVVLLAAVFMLGEYPRRKIVLPMIAIWFVFMVWSRARASVIAAILGCVVLLVLAQPFRNRFGWRLRLNVRRSQAVAFIVVAGVLGGIFDLATQGGITKSVVAFLNKGGNEAQTTEIDTEQMLASRQGLIDLSWANFQERPLTGIGFQVATTPAFIQNATLFTAPVEKGFLVTAVLEEGGIFGATAFCAFMLAFLIELAISRNVPAIAMLLAFLTSNMAEVTIFSPGGSGSFGWTMIGAAMILGDHCWHKPLLQPGSGRR